jgi:hypothetical protein
MRPEFWRIRGTALSLVTAPQECIAKHVLQRVHRNDCIAKTASQSLQRQDCTARVHRKEWIAKTASQLFQQLGLVLNGAETRSAAKRNKPLTQRHAIAATLIGRCSTVLRNRHHGHAKKASFGSSGRATHAMLTSQASATRKKTTLGRIVRPRGP